MKQGTKKALVRHGTISRPRPRPKEEKRRAAHLWSSGVPATHGPALCMGQVIELELNRGSFRRVSDIRLPLLPQGSLGKRVFKLDAYLVVSQPLDKPANPVN